MRCVGGRKGEPGFVCPWCGIKVFTREDLDAHWASPEGKACTGNRNVNNPRQEKYWVREEEPLPKLRLVRPQPEASGE